MKRLNVIIVVVFVALVLAACGGSSDDSATSSSAPTDGSPGADQAADSGDGSDTSDDQETATTVGVGDVFDTAGGAATVTIGDETWEFVLVEDIPIANCDADFFGGFVAILTNAGANLANPTDVFSVTLPGGDFTDPPTAAVKLDASGDAEWIADETIYERDPDLPAGLGVTTFSIDGTTASGTAVFFEQESFYQFNAGNGDLVVADGTFTVTCVSDE